MSRTCVVAAPPAVSGSPPPPADSPRHPRGLYVVCATVWLERFSFYLLSALLVLYLNEQLGLAEARAVEVYGYFLCGCYLTPLLGGLLSDGRLGERRTALLGGALQAIGYGLFFSERTGILCGALALLALGSGLYKAGTQALLGSLYTFSDTRREHGFRGFYSAINLGALGAPLVGGWAQEQAGWRGSFAVASLSALLSVSVLWLGRAWLGGAGPRTGQAGMAPARAAIGATRRQLVLVLAAGVVFAVGFVQSHSSLLLWARDRTDRRLGGFEFPVAWFAAAPAALVLLLAPVLSAVFSGLRRCLCQPSPLRKIALGVAVSGLAFVPLWAASRLGPQGRRVSPLWVLSCMAMLAIGELLVPALVPAELTRLAPPDHRGRWLSYWFVTLAVGNLIGGWLHE
jgi:POT family proton-dependent oligopeptide transporter